MTDTDTAPEDDASDDLTIVDKGMADLPRNELGEIDQDALVVYVATRVAFDEAKERRKKALRLIANRRKPGGTSPDGQLSFDGVDPYDYEPGRLILGAEDPVTKKTPIIENSRSLYLHKQAEAARKMKKANEAMRQAGRAQAEASGLGVWTTERLQAGDHAEDLPFGRFVRDAEVLIKDGE